MISLLLSACGASGAAEREIEARREEYAASQELRFTAKLRANVGDTLFPCTLECAETPEGTRLRVVEPELIAGVTALLRPGETELEYDGVSLFVGDLAASGLSPLTAAPMLAQALKSGHVVRVWKETEEGKALYAAELFFSDEWELTVWYDALSLTPVRGEFCRDGSLAAVCELENFEYERG